MTQIKLLTLKIFLPMILKEQSFQIKKVKQTEKDWLLYAKGFDKPFELPKERVYGNLPPVWKFPWQYHTLNVRIVADFAVYAEMDGLVLFNLPESQYPEKAKKEIARLREEEQKIACAQQKYADSLKTQLTEYLPQVPEIKELEDSISEFPVCWQQYLKMLLPMQYRDADSRQRLYLMYWLVSIANRLYKRHIDTESFIDVDWAQLNFMFHNWTVYDLTDVFVDEIEQNPDHRNNEAFAFYFETRAELRRVLPQAPQRLEIELIKILCRLLENYAEDLALLQRRRPYTLFGQTTTTDKESYRFLRKEMKLPKFTSLIIKKQFTDEEIDDFHPNY